MRFAFSSILMAVLISNLLILLIYIVLQKKELLLSIGYQVLGIFLIFTVLRFLFPFELPITTNIYFPELLSKIIVHFLHPRFTVFSVDISFFNIFQIIWLIGILILGFRYLTSYKKLCDCLILTSSPFSNKEECKKTIEQICDEHNKHKTVFVLTGRKNTIPMVFYRKGYYILLPKSSFSSEDLYYILSHEMTHIFSHDLLLKMGIQILCILYWWNPFCYLLKKQCNILIEMRVDDTLTNGDHDRKVSYLSCLLNVLEKSSKETSLNLGIPFYRKKTSVLFHRFSILMEAPSPQKSHYALKFILLIFIGMLYIGSFFFIFEAKYTPEYIESSTIDATPANTQIIDNGDGSYSIYFYGIFVETTDSLKYYPDNLQIYKKGELYEKK